MVRFAGLALALAVLVSASPALPQSGEQCRTLATQFTKVKERHERMLEVLQQIDGRSRQLAAQADDEGGREALDTMNASREKVIEALRVHVEDMSDFSDYLETCSS